MKIGIDISQMQYPGTGVATYTKNIVSHMLEESGDHTITLFGGSLRGMNTLRKESDIFSCKKRLYPFPPTLLDRLFNRPNDVLAIERFVGSVDIFHSSDWTQPSSRKATLVTTIHDLTVLKYPEHQDPKIISVHKRRFEKILSQNVHIIADSKATKKDIVTLLKIDPVKIDVVYLAASPDFLEFSALSRQEKSTRVTAVRKKYGLEKDYILSVGTAEPRKNLAATMSAFESIHQSQYPNIELAVVGRYGWGDDARKEIAGVKLLGFVDQIDLPALYSGAKSFVYPSLYEGFGLPVLEAMSVGTPVVTSNKGSLAEVAGEAGVVVNPYQVQSIANGLVESLTNIHLYRNLGLRQAKRFSWEKAATETLAVYEKVHHKSSL